MRRTGGAWINTGTPPAQVVGLWGSGAHDVWAVAMSHVLRWDGASWVTVDVGAFGYWSAVSGDGPADVWIVGTEDGFTGPLIARHFDGSSWTKVHTGATNQLTTMWIDAIHVWVAGEGGSILRRSR